MPLLGPVVMDLIEPVANGQRDVDLQP